MRRFYFTPFSIMNTSGIKKKYENWIFKNSAVSCLLSTCLDFIKARLPWWSWLSFWGHFFLLSSLSWTMVVVIWCSCRGRRGNGEQCNCDVENSVHKADIWVGQPSNGPHPVSTSPITVHAWDFQPSEISRLRSIIFLVRWKLATTADKHHANDRLRTSPSSKGGGCVDLSHRVYWMTMRRKLFFSLTYHPRYVCFLLIYFFSICSYSGVNSRKMCLLRFICIQVCGMLLWWCIHPPCATSYFI